MLQGIFDSPDIPPQTTPEAYISQIAKKEAKYFAEVQDRGFSRISTDSAAVSRRQKLMGTVFAYHSGTWNAGECYRNYEIWRLTDRSLRFYQKIRTSDTAFKRGKALLSLINTTAQLGVALNWIP
jgi:hypothetical protein